MKFDYLRLSFVCFILQHTAQASSLNKDNFDVETTGNCSLPSSWTGKYFQSQAPNLIQIDEKSIEGKGTCYANSGDKFLFVDKNNCHRCLIIDEKHPNVLAYIESPDCHDGQEVHPISELCNSLENYNDAIVYELFRADGQPIRCPFTSGTFTYNRFHTPCEGSLSYVDKCTDPSRLRFRYSACPNIKSESTEEELVCLADWRERALSHWNGVDIYRSSPYTHLVGKINHPLAVSDEDRYRCFLYERFGNDTFKIAMSEEATCQGIFTPDEGPRTLTLTRVKGQCAEPVRGAAALVHGVHTAHLFKFLTTLICFLPILI